MTMIRSVRKIHPTSPNGKTIVYMLGYGGRSWQAGRHLRVLQDQGYELLVIDFKDVLKRHDPQDLVALMSEVSSLLEQEELIARTTILIGVSLGGLVGYNLVRNYPVLDKLLVITGGDMTHIPSPKALQKRWRVSRDQLAEHWKDVNIYTPVGAMQGKHVIMLLPSRDKVIDPQEVKNEIARHTHLNDFTVISVPGGHFRTIIHQTIISPKKSLPLVERLAKL